MDAVVHGLVLGGLYALVGQGLVLTFVTTKTINFATGEFMALGAFIALAAGSWSWLPAAGRLAVGLLAVAIAGALTYRFLIVPFSRSQHDSRWLLSTVGLSYVMTNLLTNGEGASPQKLDMLRAQGAQEVLGASVNKQGLLIAVLAVAVTLALVAAARWTPGGLLMRAVAEDAETVSLMGVSPRLVGMGAFALASVIAGLAGILWAAEVGVTPGLGFNVLVSAFAVSVIGGLTSFWGPLLGGALYAVVVQVGAYEVGALWGQILGLVLVIAVLTVRPEGLLGRRMEAKL